MIEFIAILYVALLIHLAPRHKIILMVLLSEICITTFYVRYLLSMGVADSEWIYIDGDFELVPGFILCTSMMVIYAGFSLIFRWMRAYKLAFIEGLITIYHSSLLFGLYLYSQLGEAAGVYNVDYSIAMIVFLVAQLCIATTGAIDGHYLKYPRLNRWPVFDRRNHL